MKKNRMLAGLFAAVMLLAGAGGNVSAAEAEREAVTNAEFPGELAKIPEDYFTPSDSPGTLVELEYDTYEAMSYEEESQVLHKRAIVYLPYGYSDEVQYNVTAAGVMRLRIWEHRRRLQNLKMFWIMESLMGKYSP